MSRPTDMRPVVIRLAASVLSACLLCLSLSGAAAAQTMADLRDGFMQGCRANGEAEADCACIFEGWAARVPPDRMETARIALGMYLGEQPSSTENLMAAMEMMQGLAGVAVQCATGGATLPQGLSIPGLDTGAAGSSAGGDGDVAAGLAIVQQMMDLDARQQAQEAARAEEEQRQRKAENQRIMEQTQALRSAHEAELERIHSRPIDAWAVADFEPLFDLYCRSGGGEAASCACAWPILEDLSDFNAIPYMASRDEGDDIRQRLGMADISAAIFSLREFNQRRAQCD